jgi:murein DD-endopeptidase MepM/ murein hydrolase activator NlpD
MGSAAADIVARLTLAGEQFSSENARIFAEMEKRAQDTAGRTKTFFESSFNEVEQIAKKALSLPRTSAGTLDLGVGQYKQAAAEAQLHAAAVRQVAVAAEAAAKSTGDDSEATRIYVQAARAAAIEAERDAKGKADQAAAMGQLQESLNATAAPLQAHADGLERAHGASYNLRLGQMELMHSTRSFFDMLVAGQSPLVAFSMEFGRIAQGIATMAAGMDAGGASSEKLGTALGTEAVATEKSAAASGADAAAKRGQATAAAEGSVATGANTVATGANATAHEAATVATVEHAAAQSRFAALISGPWGMAILGGVTVLGMLIPKLMGGGDEVEKLTDKMRENYRQTGLNQQATDIWKSSTEGLIESLRELDKQTAHLNQSQAQAQQAAIDEAQKKIDDLQQSLTRDRTHLNELERRRAELRGQAAAGDEGAAAALIELRQVNKDIATTENLIIEGQRRIAGGYQDLREAQIAKDRREVADATDAVAVANAKLTATEDRLTEARRRGDLGEAEYKKQLLDAQRLRDKEVKAAQDAEREARDKKIILARPVDGPITSGYGARPRPKEGASTWHPAIDFGVGIGTAVRAQADGVVIKTGIVGKLGRVVWIDYGNKVIAEFGHLSQELVSEGQVVHAGQVVARSGNTGLSTGPHLDYRLKVQGAYVNPLTTKVNVGKGVGDAMGDYEREQAAAEERRQHQAEQLAETRERILASLRDEFKQTALNAQADSLRARGLTEQADTMVEVARLARERADELAKLPESERVVTPALVDQLALYRQQADAVAQLMVANGSRAALTEQQKAAEEALNAQMLARFATAKGLVKTAADELAIKDAQLDVGNRLGAAAQQAAEATREQKRADEERQRYLKHQQDEMARREREQISTLADFYERAFRSGGKSIVQDFKDEMLGVIAQIAARWTLALLSGQQTSLPGILSQMGATANNGGYDSKGIFGMLMGFGQGGGGGVQATQVGDFNGIPLLNFGLGQGGDFAAAGGVAGGAATGGLGGLGGLAGLGGAGSALPAAGAAMAASMLLNKIFGIKDPTGGLLGPISAPIVNSFIPAKRGSATLDFTNGALGVGATRGNSSSRIDTSKGDVGQLADILNRIAEQFDGHVSKVGGISFGVRDGNFRLDPTGQGITKTKNGALDFGKDEQAMLRKGVELMLERGVIDGLSDAEKKILSSGQDIDKALTKALLIHDIPKRLMEHLDPVGAAIDALNKKWADTIDALNEGGASTEQMADAQKLYKMELADVKNATQEASAGLKSFLDSLNFGSASPYSLHDQEAMAKAALQPFLDQIDADGGQSIDKQKYQASAQSFLDIERQIYGSTKGFFDAMDMIQAYTGKAISAIDNAKPIRTYADPFAEKTADNTTTANEIAAQHTGLLLQIRDAVTALGGAPAGGFIGGGRGFAAAMSA